MSRRKLFSNSGQNRLCDASMIRLVVQWNINQFRHNLRLRAGSARTRFVTASFRSLLCGWSKGDERAYGSMARDKIWYDLRFWSKHVYASVLSFHRDLTEIDLVTRNLEYWRWIEVEEEETDGDWKENEREFSLSIPGNVHWTRPCLSFNTVLSVNISNFLSSNWNMIFWDCACINQFWHGTWIKDKHSP
jgi:hypothetical protein